MGYEVCSKCIKTETALTKTEMNNKWTINFLQNSPLDIQQIYSSELFISRNTSEIPLFDMVWNHVGVFFF